MRLLLILALTATGSTTATAQHQTFAVTPDASTVKIALKTTHELVSGTFHVDSGSVVFDRNEPRMEGSVVVVAGSGKTGNDLRDKRMNKEILKVEQFSQISFAPESYTGTIAAIGDSSIQVAGVFTLAGTPHKITVPMQVHIEGDKATAKAQFVIPYVQWGLKNPSFMFWKAENDVAIDLNLVGQLSH